MIVYNWSEAFGFSWYDEEMAYLVTSTFYDQLFDHSYDDPLKQYADLDDLSDDYASYKAISKIMKAYHFQILVDLYGNIPYFDALKRGENATPKYDDAAAIYADLLVQLTEAIDIINTAEAAAINILPGNDDVIFGGNMMMWKQFANTIKLRILVRGANTLNVASEIATIVAEGSGYITDDVIVQPGYLKETAKQNIFWDEFGSDVGGTTTSTNRATCATQYVLDLLAATNDTRLDRIYELPATGHLGVEQGANPNDQAFGYEYVSNIGPGLLKSPTMGANIFSLAESYFNQAELALNGFGGDPEALYNMGVKASFDYLGVDSDDYDDYIGQGVTNVTYANSSNKLEAIITQKWIAVNGITAEQSWFDLTRTGYPTGLPIPAGASSTTRPVRLAYPSSEITGNTLNVPKPQPNVFTAKLFWAN
jgi:hypothetical protein